MSDYPDRYNPDLLDRIPTSARVVFDVGCGTGSLGAAYRRINPRARLLGIDSDPRAAAIASGRLDGMALADVETDPLPFPDTGPIDCIVYGDVLEHLRDPFAVLRRHAEALADDGTMLICVPNVAHWSFTARLFDGSWAYEPDGLLDSTHLRWFTLETMRRGLEAAGLFPYDVQPRIFDADHAERFIGAVAPALAALGIDQETYRRRALPLQYVWRACKRPAPLLGVSATMLQPVGGVSHTRVLHPLQSMATHPGVSVRLLQGAEVSLPGPAEMPRILVLHRPILAGEEGAASIRSLLGGGWVVVTEFDDHPDHFPAMRRDDVLTFRGVHAVQTSTEPLAEILRAGNPEVQVFPNAIRALPEVRNFADPEHMTMFFGALNRERDWEPYLPVLNAVAAIMGPRLRFHIVHDRALFEALQTPHKDFTPTCDYETYMDLLGRCELSFMPLGDTAFNRAKSDLKFVEAGACRVCAIASEVVYGGSVENGRTGMLFASPDQLRTRLLRAAAMPEIARAIGDAARGLVAEQRMLSYQAAARMAWYRDLWDRREELTEALLARSPEVAGFRPSPHAGPLPVGEAAK